MEIALDLTEAKTPLFILLAVALVSLVGGLGYRATPVSDGELRVLTPRLWQRYQFLRKTETYLAALSRLDHDLITGDLTTGAQLSDQALHLADRIAVVPGPSECIPVRDQLEIAALTYHDAANAVVQAHLGAGPDPTPVLNQARTALASAIHQWEALQP
jgi:hypothetical protein